MQFKLMYPNFLSKAFTTSYDDGVIQDVRLIIIFRKYGIKGTFNLNFGLQGEKKYRDGIYQKDIDCSRLILTDNIDLYSGFEVASHSLTHPFLERLDYSKQYEEISKDVQGLSKLFNAEILGSAYPYGTYNQDTIKALEQNGILYSRTTRSTYSFSRPYNFYLWHPTIHHRDNKLFETFDRFLESKEELALFYLWGHAYEFALDNNFEMMDEFCKKVSQHKDQIYLASNIEICQYIKAAELLYYKKREEGYFINPSSKDIYFITEKGDKLVIHPNERIKYE